MLGASKEDLTIGENALLLQVTTKRNAVRDLEQFIVGDRKGALKIAADKYFNCNESRPLGKSCDRILTQLIVSKGWY